jgi:hypothetical protein
MAFSGDFTPVLAKHSKSFSLLDSISVGIDRMQRNFEPMRKQVEAWRGSELTLFFVVSEDRIADNDALVADVGAAGKLRWIGNERIYVVFGFAAKRTPEDLIVLAALENHESSMPGQRQKSRCAKVQIGAVRRAKALLCSNAS